MSDLLNGQSEQSPITFNGDQRVEFAGRDGTTYSIGYVGLGHPMHTVSTQPGDSPRGRVSTDAEATLVRLLIAQNEATR